MTGKEIIIYIIDNDLLDKELEFTKKEKTIKKERAKKKKEPKSLDEITRFEYEYERAVLYVSDPVAARKFGLNDKYVKYEYDGKSMYFFLEEDGPSKMSVSWNSYGRTLVSDSLETCIMAVIKQMRHLWEKNKVAIKSEIIRDELRMN